MSEVIEGAYNPELQAIVTYVEDNNEKLYWRRVWHEGSKFYDRDGLSWLRMRYASHDGGSVYATFLLNSCNIERVTNLPKLAGMYEVGNQRAIFKDLDERDVSVVAGILDYEMKPLFLSPGVKLERLKDIIDKTSESHFI